MVSGGRKTGWFSSQANPASHAPPLVPPPSFPPSKPRTAGLASHPISCVPLRDLSVFNCSPARNKQRAMSRDRTGRRRSQPGPAQRSTQEHEFSSPVWPSTGRTVRWHGCPRPLPCHSNLGCRTSETRPSQCRSTASLQLVGGSLTQGSGLPSAMAVD